MQSMKEKTFESFTEVYSGMRRTPFLFISVMISFEYSEAKMLHTIYQKHLANFIKKATHFSGL